MAGSDASAGRLAGSALPPGWPDLDALPGVADAVERARTAIVAVRALPANRRGWARTSSAAAVRAARASAMLDGGSVSWAGTPDTDEPVAVTDPVLAGALRATAAIGELAAVWRRAPLQALARLHTLAGADLASDEALGRPRGDAALGPRLTALAHVVTESPWSGPVTVAVVHAELLTLHPFGSADGVVARAAARLTMVATGLDPQALTVPEVGHLRAGARYADAAAGYATGDGAAVAAWIVHVCEALQAGAREARSIARAAPAP